MLTTSPDTGADNWWLGVGGGWRLVVGGGCLVVAGCWWLGRAPSPAPATQITPAQRRRPCRSTRAWEASKGCACHANPTGAAAATHERQGDARVYIAAAATHEHQGDDIRPPGEHEGLCLPRKSQRHSGGGPIHPNLWRAPSAAPATQISSGSAVATDDSIRPSTKCCACHANPTGAAAATHERQGDARVYIAAAATHEHQGHDVRPPGEHEGLCLPHKSRSGGGPVHPNLWRAPSAAPATQISSGSAVATYDRQGDARAYIRLSGACHANHSGAAAVTIGWWQLVGGSWLVAVCGWKFVGGNWLVAVGWLVAVVWWQLVAGN